ncbi:MAG: TRAP transporter large permease [Burkholderiales bacterium]|nr:TRAP transporter large permease [Burkholderiales bacterium]
MILGTVVAFMLAMMLARVPIAFALFAAGVVGLVWIGDFGVLLGVLETAPVSSAAAYEFITVPMFILMAEFVILSGVADGLFRTATAWVGRMPGGLAIATALAGAGFGAISGSSTAAAATLSSTTIPAMLRANYEPRLACGVVAISGTLAMLIPPSVALVLYGLIADVSIGQLLIAGVVPGLIVTAVIAGTVLFLVWQDPSRAPVGRAYSWREKFASLKVTGPMALLFVCVTGVIYLGVCTPTEASAIGAIGALALTGLAGRLSWKTMREAAYRTALTTCMILAIIMTAHIFGYFLALTGATRDLVAWIASLGLSKWMVLFLIFCIYLLLGCFVDQVAILILTVPVVVPVIKLLGFDPVWFGVMVVVLAEVGLVTPPVGLNVFVVARYTGRPVEEVFRGVWPHVVAHLAVIALLTVFPQLVMWLPGTMKP